MVTTVCTDIMVVSGVLSVRKQNMLRGWIAQWMAIVTVHNRWQLHAAHAAHTFEAAEI
jgi:hypothetical protein